MKNKNGYSLVEILAVIALISVIMLLVVPNVIEYLNQGRKTTFYDEVLNIYKTVSPTYISRSSDGDYRTKFCKSDSNMNLLDMSDKQDIYYNIDVNTDGEVIRMEIMNKKYYIIVENINGIKKNDIKIDDIVDSKDKTMSAC